MGVVYSQYWMQEGADDSFAKHKEVIKLCDCEVYSVETGEVLKTIMPLLTCGNWDAQQGLFKLCMKSNCDAAMDPPYSTNYFNHLWKMLTNTQLLCPSFPKFMKLIEIAMVYVMER